MNDFEYFWEYQLKDGLSEVIDLIKRITEYITNFFGTLPPIMRTIFFILFSLAVVGILASHVKSIIKNKGEWKKHPKNNLMFSYFCGSGAYQRKLIYKDAHAFLHDRKWSWVSLAGLAWRLGNLTHPSKTLMFVCSLVYLPAALLGFVEMVLRDVIGTVYLLAVSLIHRLILLVLRWISYLLIPLWQIVDKSVRINQHCPNCYGTFNLPAFRCPHCGKIHKDLIPSRCGIIIARCECGGFMASSALTGRSQIDAVCPVCEADLVAANVKQFSIQLVGGNTSGKTAFLASFQHLYLDRTFGMKNLTVYGKPQEYFDDLEAMYKDGQTQPSSATSVMTYSLLHKIKQTGKHSLVIYDIPDEVVLNGGYERNPRNLGFTDGIVIIIDPLSVALVREECFKSGDKHEVDNYSTDDVNEVIVEFVHQFSSITGRTARKQIEVPVAIIINKTDVKAVKREIGLPKIKATYNANPGAYRNDITLARDEICRAYLEHLGLDNALNNLDGIFSNIRYFPVSAMGHLSTAGKAFEPFGVMEPVTWMASEAKASFLHSVLRNTQDSVVVNEKEDSSKEDYLSGRFQQAEVLLQNNQYDAALKIFISLKDYKDSAKRMNDVKTLQYQQAENLLSSGQFQQAINIFKTLGKFKDAPNRITEARYLHAVALLAQDDYIGALAIFNALGNYKDAEQKAASLLPGLIKQGQTKGLSFGKFKWCVLSVVDNKALLLSEDILENRAYHSAQTDITWENSTVRAYLNGDFYKQFSSKERAVITSSNVINSDNSQHGTIGGNSTFDNILLLSLSEVNQFFGNNADRASKNSGQPGWWWLRSPGGRGVYAAIVDKDGKISDGGNMVDNASGGIRPALWIKL